MARQGSGRCTGESEHYGPNREEIKYFFGSIEVALSLIHGRGMKALSRRGFRRCDGEALFRDVNKIRNDLDRFYADINEYGPVLLLRRGNILGK